MVSHEENHTRSKVDTVSVVLVTNQPGRVEKNKPSGNTVSDDIVQINTVVIEKGEKPLEELIGAQEE